MIQIFGTLNNDLTITTDDGDIIKINLQIEDKCRGCTWRDKVNKTVSVKGLLISEKAISVFSPNNIELQ